jgi:hypothetical protein
LDDLYPLINFNASEFLQTYYQIDSVETFYNFLRNNKLYPVITKLRIIDCFIISYGKDVTMVDNIFSETILNIIKSFWIKKMYGKLAKYVMCHENDKCMSVQPNKNTNTKIEHMQQRIKYMYSNILTEENITFISNNYFNELSHNDKKYTFFSEGISDYYKYLMTNIVSIIIQNIKK